MARDWSEEDDFDPNWHNHETEVRKRKMYGTRHDDAKLWNGKPVRDMETDHIMNAILFCEKKFVDCQQIHSVCFGGADSFYFNTVFEMFPDYRNLRDEWAKRNRD